MKTSNKILLITFLTSLLILVSVHIALYAKYKSGDYSVIAEEWLPNLATYSLEKVKYVSVDNIENINLQLADTSKLQYERADEDDENILSFSKNRDTLFVVGKSNKGNIGRWYKRTNLYLSDKIQLTAINSNLHVIPSSKKTTSHSFEVVLNDALIDFNGQNKNGVLPDSFSIRTYNKSTILLNDFRISAMTLSLRDSYLEGNNVTADHINITTDSLSQIKLSAQNLLKAKISAHE